MDKYYMDQEKSNEIAQILNIYLANLNILNTKLHNYHWNIIGTDFFTFHRELEIVNKTILDHFSQVGKRIVMLGNLPIGTLEESIKLSTITESLSTKITSEEIAMDLIEDYTEMLSIARYITNLATDNKDDVTMTILTNHMNFYEKTLWFLSAYLSKD